MNNKEIYPLLDCEPVVIPLENDNPRLVVTDGFHFTRPLQLTFKQPSYYNFNVVCAIDDMQLLTAFIMVVAFYLLGLFTNFLPLKILSFMPILWFLFYYYINRKDFIRIVKAKQ